MSRAEREHIELLEEQARRQDELIDLLRKLVSAANNLSSKYARAVCISAFIAGFCVGLAVGVA